MPILEVLLVVGELRPVDAEGVRERADVPAPLTFVRWLLHSLLFDFQHQVTSHQTCGGRQLRQCRW